MELLPERDLLDYLDRSQMSSEVASKFISFQLKRDSYLNNTPFYRTAYMVLIESGQQILKSETLDDITRQEVRNFVKHMKESTDYKDDDYTKLAKGENPIGKIPEHFVPEKPHEFLRYEKDSLFLNLQG